MAKKRGGGPKSEDGKRNSSRNSTTHGCRAKTRILADEKQEDYDKIALGWKEEYEPEGYMEERLVEVLIENDWMLRRVMRRLEETELGTHDFDLMLRYKVTAERSFYRSLNAVQQLRKDAMRQERDTEWWKDRAHKLEKELEKRPPAPDEGPKAKQEELKAETKETLRSLKPLPNVRGSDSSVWISDDASGPSARALSKRRQPHDRADRPAASTY